MNAASPPSDTRALLAWCREMLPLVSRTFALGILAMPPPYDAWIGTGYLLCRIVDTVEDAPGLPWQRRREMFLAFEQALDGGDPTVFAQLASALPDDDEGNLARDLPRLVALLETFPSGVRQSVRRHVGEMTHGMMLYSRRHALSSGLAVLDDLSDLRRYCWFVAGTVGYMLTELFAEGSDEVRSRMAHLRRHAEGFGLVLQLTNIVKDVTDDRSRGWSFVPQAVCVAHGVSVEDLLDPKVRDRALDVINEVVRFARSFVSDAIAYIIALPRQEPALRRFCLFPLLLAHRTLALAQGNPAVLTPGTPVKVDRSVVAAVARQVEELLTDDEAIAGLVQVGRAPA